MASGILGIAMSGLNAAQAGISTAQHNIANVNTIGFRRQEVQYAAQTPSAFGSMFYGSGVSVTSVRNLYSQFQDNQVLLNQAQLSRSQTYATQAGQIDQLLSDTQTGLTAALDAFFSATQTVAGDPTADAARQVMLSSGRNLVARFNSLYGSLDGMRTDSNRELASTVSSINSYSEQIAGLSRQIVTFESSSGQQANDLRDQRDQLVAELNKRINVTSVEQNDGTFNVYIGSGQPLVVGGSVSRMSVEPGRLYPEFGELTLNLAGGATQTLGSDLITGGTLGGVLAVREDLLQPAMRELDRMALVFASEFNRLHQGGFDLSGTAGGNFFTAATALSPHLQPAALSGNTGNQLISATLTDATQLAASEYLLAYDGANYTLTRLSDGVSASDPSLAVVTTLGGAAQGFTLAAGAGTPNAGDRWIVRPSYGAASMIGMDVGMTDPNRIAASSTSVDSPGNNQNALLLAGLQTLTTSIGGTHSFYSAYTQLVGRTATLAAGGDIDLQAYTVLTEQSNQAKLAVSGVNLDEEAINLIRFQQAYQASAKAMQVATSLFDQLIGILR